MAGRLCFWPLGLFFPMAEETRKARKEIVLITGSCGLLGSAITRALSDRYQVVDFDLVDAPPLRFSSYHQVDLTSDESVREGLDAVRQRHGAKLASVIHLAAYYSFSGEPSPLYEKVTVQGTERLLKALRGLEVQQFIFSSTMLVHAPSPGPGVKIAEDSPIVAKWDYPESKRKTEQVIRTERGKIPAVIARIAGVYDEGCHSIPIAHQIQRIYERQVTARFYPGDLDRGQAFVHLDDVVDAIARMVERRTELAPEECFLIGEEKTLGYGKLQRRLGQLLHGEPWETRRISKRMAKTGAWLQEKSQVGDAFIKPWMIDLADDHYELDTSHARKALGWKPRHSLGETLPEMVTKLKEDPVGWYQANKLDLPASLERKAG